MKYVRLMVVLFVFLYINLFPGQASDKLRADFFGNICKLPATSFKNIKTIENDMHVNGAGVTVISSEQANSFIIYAEIEGKDVLIGYSLNSHINNEKEIPPALRSLLGKQTVSSGKILNKYSFQGTPTKQNDKLMDSGLPLVKAQWNQNYAYDIFCPDNCPPGCVAVAYGQVMRYWEYPKYGSGSHSYKHQEYGTLSVDFEEFEYKLSEMPYTAFDPDTSISRFLYHLGVAMEMDYGTWGSANSLFEGYGALQRNFSYSNNIYAVKKDDSTAEYFSQLLKDEIDSKRPIVMSGGGHAFVCDAYNSNGYFHINWGWGGDYDGFYHLDFLNPNNKDYSSGLGAVLNIYPKYLDAVQDTVYELTEGTCMFNNDNAIDTIDSFFQYHTYNHQTDVRWKFNIPDNKKITIHFNYFALNKGDTLFFYRMNGEEEEIFRVLTGYEIPADTLLSHKNLYLRFKADEHYNARGWEIEYTNLKYDIALVEIQSPNSGPYANYKEKIRLSYKNKGYETLDEVPITITANDSTWTHILKGEIKYNEEIVANDCYMKTEKGNMYELSISVDMPGIDENEENNTARHKFVKYNYDKPVYPIYYKRAFEDTLNSGKTLTPDWSVAVVTNQYPHPDKEGVIKLLQPAGPINQNSYLYFRFKAFHDGVLSLPFEFSDETYFTVKISKDGKTSDAVLTIDKDTYVPSTDYHLYKISLADFVADSIIVFFDYHAIYKEFEKSWNNYYYFDNILICDEIEAGDIDAPDVLCSYHGVITGDETKGGSLVARQYIWQVSGNGTDWNDENITYNHEYCPETVGNMFYRRIYRDFAGITDTSNIIETEVLLSPESNFDYEISNNLKVEFQNYSLEAGSYLWDFGDGSSSDEENPVHGYSSAGEYSVRLITYNGECSDTLSKLINTGTVGVEETFSSSDFRICPNPAGDYIKIINPENVILNKVQIFDLNGRIILEKVIMPEMSGAIISLEGLMPGLYQLRILSDNSIDVIKLIVR